MIRNNQNGRRRGRGGGAPRPQQGTGGGNYGNNGSRIDNRQRGNATQLLEKYKAMARDATQNGDRVQAEFYMQYADHYFRVLSEFRARDPQPAPRSTYDDDDDGCGAAPGQNYSTADRDIDDGDDDRNADRTSTDRGLGADRGFGGSGPAGSGGERQPYRVNGERSQGGYQGQPRGDDRDGRPRYARDSDDGRSDAGRGDGDGSRRENRDHSVNAQRHDGDGPRRDGNGDASRRDGGRSEAWRSDGGRNDGPRNDGARSDAGRRDGGRSDAGRSEGAGIENGRGDGVRADGFRRDVSRPREWNGNRRDAGLRGDEPLEAESPADDTAAALIGLPGPATLAPTPAPAVPEAVPVGTRDAAEPPTDLPIADVVATDAPAPRRRGRPRKVVPDVVDG